MGEGLVGEAALQADRESRHCAAVLRALLEGQGRIKKSEIRGSLCGAPPEAQRGHGEEDNAAAAQNKPAGSLTPLFDPPRWAVFRSGTLWNLLATVVGDTLGHWELSYHMNSMCVHPPPPPAASRNQRAQ